MKQFHKRWQITKSIRSTRLFGYRVEKFAKKGKIKNIYLQH